VGTVYPEVVKLELDAEFKSTSTRMAVHFGFETHLISDATVTPAKTGFDDRT
jgi:hypothetical protein